MPKSRRIRKQDRRFRAALMFKDGYSPAEVAAELGVSRQSACRWFHLWSNGGGYAALRSRGPVGRKPKLSGAQLEHAAAELHKQARKPGSGKLSLAVQARLVEELTGVEYHPRYLGQLLRKRGHPPWAK